jgi:glucose-6-phosphate isomerase
MKCFFDNAQVPKSFFAEHSAAVDSFLRLIRRVRDGGGYDAPESSVNLLDDEEGTSRIKNLAAQKTEGIRFVILIGIGGSNLGAEATYRALKTDGTRDMFFLEGVDPRAVRDVARVVNACASPAELLVCVISKSGTTLETITNADILLGILRERFGEREAEGRVVVISDEDSVLLNLARSRGIASLPIPAHVGGRYSIFSAAGLFPLIAAGLDTEGLIRGARDERERCLSEDAHQNPALHSALFLTFHYKNGLSIHDTFFFDPSLEKLGAWYRQLLAESIGKRSKDEHGSEVRIGITPTTSIGSRDLHSIGQLMLDGPRDKTVTLVRDRAVEPSYSVAENGLLSSLVPNISGRSMEEINTALFIGAQRAFTETNIPFLEVELDGVTAYEIGSFMQWRMIETMLLGRLLGVNPFDQPSVETYKKASREFLETEHTL